MTNENKWIYEPKSISNGGNKEGKNPSLVFSKRLSANRMKGTRSMEHNY
jgi:hypothetical protein